MICAKWQCYVIGWCSIDDIAGFCIILSASVSQIQLYSKKSAFWKKNVKTLWKNNPKCAARNQALEKKQKMQIRKAKEMQRKMQRTTCFFSVWLAFFCIFIRKNKPKKNAFDFLWPFFAFSFAFFNCSITFAFSFAFFAFSKYFFLHLLGGLVLHLLFFNCVFFRIILSGWHKSTIFPCDYDIEWQTCSARIINPNKKVLVQLSLRILWCQENRWWWTRHCGRTFGASWQGQHLTILTYFDFPKSNQRDKCSQFPSSLIERLPRTLMSDSLYTTLCLTMKSLRRSRVYLTLFDYIWLHLTQMRKTWSCDMHCRHAKAALYNHQSV